MINENLVLSTIYLAGILSFFSPCIFPVLPVYFSILSTGGKKSIIKTVMFLLGLSMAFIILGIGARTLGGLIYNSYFRIIGGVIVVILGLFQMDIIKINFLNRTKTIEIDEGRTGIFTPFLLGFTFSFGWTPCIGPVLSSILFSLGTIDTFARSIFLMGVYILGLATPFIIFSFFSKEVMKRTKFINKYLNISKKIGGIIIIIMGILLLFDKINSFSRI